MLWLCISLPQLSLEALRSDEAGRAIVVTACAGNTRWIVCTNAAAERANLKPGMNYGAALAIHPDMTVLERNLMAERAALNRLAAWAYQFSSTVIPGTPAEEPQAARTCTLWLEIGASLTLFGGFRTFITHLEQELSQLHYSYLLGIAPTLEGAALLARAGIRLVTTTPEAFHARIRNLPISMLALAPDVTRVLHTTGVRTIGLLLELPRASVVKRFGVELGNFLDRLLGMAPDPRPAFQLPHQYDACFHFEFEVGSTEALLFPLRRLLYEFAGFLRARDTGVQHFTITFVHRDVAPTALRVGMSMSERNAERFFALVREQLERLELPAPTLALHLSAEHFSAPAALQSNLFDSSLQQNEDLAHTIDRIAARLGAERIHALKCVADHRPEASWAAASLDERRAALHFPDRPLWLLPEPKPLQLSAIPQIVAGPERIEAGWWDTGDVQRDYYVVHTNQGAGLWVYRDLANSNWYLHGFWS
jgi:protein ImuB